MQNDPWTHVKKWVVDGVEGNHTWFADEVQRLHEGVAGELAQCGYDDDFEEEAWAWPFGCWVALVVPRQEVDGSHRREYKAKKGLVLFFLCGWIRKKNVNLVK